VLKPGDNQPTPAFFAPNELFKLKVFYLPLEKMCTRVMFCELNGNGEERKRKASDVGVRVSIVDKITSHKLMK
jgi:hypothetical protein